MISPADLTEEDLKPKGLGVVEDWILADLAKPKKFQKSPRQLKKNHKRYGNYISNLLEWRGSQRKKESSKKMNS